MNYRDVKCSECGVGMETGFLIEKGHGGEESLTEWHPGEVEFKTFLGLNFGIRIQKSKKLKVKTYRCPKCGVLRSFADSE